MAIIEDGKPGVKLSTKFDRQGAIIFFSWILFLAVLFSRKPDGTWGGAIYSLFLLLFSTGVAGVLAWITYRQRDAARKIEELFNSCDAFLDELEPLREIQDISRSWADEDWDKWRRKAMAENWYAYSNKQQELHRRWKTLENAELEAIAELLHEKCKRQRDYSSLETYELLKMWNRENKARWQILVDKEYSNA